MSESTLLDGDDLLARARDNLREAGRTQEKAEHWLASSLGQSHDHAHSSADTPLEAQLFEHDRLRQYLRWTHYLLAQAETCQRLLDQTRSADAESGSDAMATATAAAAAPQFDADRSQELCVRLWQMRAAALGPLSDSGCAHLRAFGRHTWERVQAAVVAEVKRRIELEDLVALDYPQCILSSSSSSSSGDDLSGLSHSHLARFRAHFLLLADLDAPPTDLLMKPLKKRFRFHFHGSKKTNNRVRPEWYLQQVQSWLVKTASFYTASLADEPHQRRGRWHGLLARELLRLATSKLRADIVQLVYDDVLFSHAIDELLRFTKDVGELDLAVAGDDDDVCHLSGRECHPVSVLAEETAFTRWLSLERKYAFEKIDVILLDNDCWIPSPSNPEVLKCVEIFLSLLQSLTHRYKQLPYAKLQLKFVRLQYELLEDFRLRLVQILRQEQTFPLSEKYARILNSAQHLIHVLQDWREWPMFLQLYRLDADADAGADAGAERHRRHDLRDGGELLFSSAIGGFQFLIDDMNKTIATHIFQEVRARSVEYRRNVNWLAYEGEGSVLGDGDGDGDGDGGQDRGSGAPCVCLESLGMFQALTSNLDLVSERVNANLLQSVLEYLAGNLSDFFLHEVLLANVFNEAGCRQVCVDIRQGVITIFNQLLYDVDGRCSLKRLTESLTLLQLSRANALLLIDAIQGNPGGDINGVKDALADFNITTLSGSMAVKVLERRASLMNV